MESFRNYPDGWDSVQLTGLHTLRQQVAAEQCKPNVAYDLLAKLGAVFFMETEDGIIEPRYEPDGEADPDIPEIGSSVVPFEPDISGI